MTRNVCERESFSDNICYIYDMYTHFKWRVNFFFLKWAIMKFVTIMISHDLKLTAKFQNAPI